MTSAAAVLVCALEVLGRSPGSLPRIEVLDKRPSTLSSNAAAFVNHRENVIYLIGSASAFQEAREARSRCGNLEALKVVASVIVHEEWHLRHGFDEAGAYHAQLMALHKLGLGPGTATYAGVQRAMQAALRRQASRDRLAASQSDTPASLLSASRAR
jgi:hypothetical protein